MMDASVSTVQGTVTPRGRLDHEARNRAFQRLYDRHFRLVWSVVRGGGVPPAQCEDVAQEVWIQVHRLLHRLREDASERAWLVSIARKRVLQHHRTHHRQQRRERAFGEAAPGASDGERSRVEAKSMVDRMLDRMNDEQRLTYVLVHGYGLTGEEVAAAVGDSVNTVYSRLRLARRHVRRVADAAEIEERRVAKTLWTPPPSRHTERRMWAGLVGPLGLGASLGGASAGAGLGSLVGTFGVAIAGLVLLRVALGPSSPPAPEPRDEIVAQASVAQLADPSDEPRPAAEPALVTTATSEVSDDGGPPIPRAMRRSRPPAAAPTAPTLAAEVALLKDAKQALNRNAPAEALALLDEHARQFPHGTLEDVRRGARVRALCALGRAPQAQGEARRLSQAGPGSVVAAGVQDVCARQRPGAPDGEHRG